MGDLKLTPELVVRAYAAGAFPMASGREGRIDWHRPDPRAILPLDERFHVPRSLRKRVRSGRFTITIDHAFERVIRACAQPTPSRPDTWINETIIDLYTALHRRGLAHSVEAWRPEDDSAADPSHPRRDEPPPRRDADASGEAKLVGGLYGVALGAAFFGESMFSRQTDASKVCLVRLVERLRAGGFTLLDVQFYNPHLEQFGLMEVPASAYLAQLHETLRHIGRWRVPPEAEP